MAWLAADSDAAMSSLVRRFELDAEGAEEAEVPLGSPTAEREGTNEQVIAGRRRSSQGEGPRDRPRDAYRTDPDMVITGGERAKDVATETRGGFMTRREYSAWSPASGPLLARELDFAP